MAFLAAALPFLGKAAASAAASFATNKILGKGAKFAGNLAASQAENYLTGRMDYNFRRRAADDNINRLRAMGLTPQEIAGTGAAGGASTSGPTLGNGPATQLMNAQNEREKDRQLEREKMRTGLIQTEMQTRATLGAAQTAANANIYSTDTRAKTDSNRLNFDREQFALTMEKHPQQLQKIANEAMTSSPAFVTYMKALGMSAENLKATAIYNKWEAQGFDVLDPKDWASATDGDKREVMLELAKFASTAYREWTGSRAAGQEAADMAQIYLDKTDKPPQGDGWEPVKLFGLRIAWSRPAK